jgi:hypothetical protein
MRAQPKVKPIHKPVYRNFMSMLPCSIPGCPADACGHHEQEEGQGCMGGKCCDSRMLPLCKLHHQQRHNDGRTFWWWQKLDPEELIRKTRQKWIDAGKKQFW